MVDIAGGVKRAPVLGPWRGAVLPDDGNEAEVRTVAMISDLHLGAGNCVLDEPVHAERFARLLDDRNVKVDALVLNGDMCDFALATLRDTVASARRFLAIMARHCKQIVYIPGNHDHHSWLLANEVHEVLFAMPDLEKDCAQRTERMYDATFLRRLMPSDDCPMRIAYPNVYWQPPDARDTTCIFHHGHYCEDLYSIISSTLNSAFPPGAGEDRKGLEFLEATNFGWLEFVWYQLGQMGKSIGADGLIERLYEQIRGDDTRQLETGIRLLYEARFRPVVHRALRDEANDKWWITKGMAETAANYIDTHAPSMVIAMIKSYAQQQPEKATPGHSDWLLKALDADLAKHCYNYIDCSRSSPFLPVGHALKFFFGHTHSAGEWHEPDKPSLYNDGGWIRDPKGNWPDAHVLLIDSHGEVADLKFGAPT